MDKNTTIAFILIGGILIFWLYMNSPKQEQVVPPAGKDSLSVVQDSLADSEKRDTVAASETAEHKKGIAAVTDSASSDYGKYFSNTNTDKKDEIFTVENDLALIEFSSHGGNIHKYYLKKYNNWYSAGKNGDGSIYQTKVQLIDYNRGNALDLSFVTTDGKAINTAKMNFDLDIQNSKKTLTGEDSLIFTYTLPTANGGAIVKRYTVYGDKYNIETDIELKGMNGQISNSAYDLVWGSGIRFVEKNSVDEANRASASIYYGGEQVIIDASSTDETEKENFNGRVDWMAVKNKYFAAVVMPEKPEEIEGAYVEGFRKVFPNEGIREYYSTRLVVPFKNTDIESRSFNVYIGPVDYDILTTYKDNLEVLVDFGSFFGLKFVVRPIAEYILLPLFNFLHTFIPNYGFVIIVFSLIIKFVLYPLTKKSYQSMKRMQLLQPKITEIKEKYKDDPQKTNKETMKLYSTYGVNPAGGCFPLLLQMPIFIALWGLFQTAIDLRQQPFIFWITDLSRPDVILDLGFKLPLFGINQISGLALLMGITTFVQQKMSVKDPKQQALIYIMPVMLTILFMTFPSGLNLYYFMFNVFSIAQQYYINHQHSDMELKPVKKSSQQKKGFMQRMMDAAEENAKKQQGKRKR